MQRLADLISMTGMRRRTEYHEPSEPSSAVYTAIWTILFVQLLIVLMTKSGRKLVFNIGDTVLAVVLVTILLGAILGLPVVALYIGVRGSILMARSLSDNFPALGLLLRPLLAIIGQQGPAAVTQQAASGGV